MENNSVHLIGIVKRDAKASENSETIDFTLEVEDERGRKSFIDCRATGARDAYDKLEGVANAGETLEVYGHLIRVTRNEEHTMSGVLVRIRVTNTIVYVDDVITEDE